jgi:hypothetical protein
MKAAKSSASLSSLLVPPFFLGKSGDDVEFPSQDPMEIAGSIF